MASLDDSSPEKPGFSTESALRALEDRLERASDAAERLIADAARAAVRTPAAGWAAPKDPSTSNGEGDRTDGQSGHTEGQSSDAGAQSDDDLATLVAFVRSLRDLVPPDLQRRVAEALREFLLALRALIDWYLERLEQRRRTPPPVEDIPIL